MGDAGVVSDSETGGQFRQHRARFFRLERAAGQDSSQRRAVDELHDEADEPLVLDVVVHRDDVRVCELGGEAGLVLEAPRHRDLVLGVGMHDLDGDATLEHVVECLPDLAHAA